MDVMLISSCNLYPFVDESPFVEREYHEIYREIYGDPIYDVYEDDEIYKEICGDPIYDVYEENDFDNLVRAKIGRNLVYAKNFKHNQSRAIFVQKQFYDEFGSVVHNFYNAFQSALVNVPDNQRKIEFGIESKINMLTHTLGRLQRQKNGKRENRPHIKEKLKLREKCS
ncbi:unnamed protein product [Brassica oleracea]